MDHYENLYYKVNIGLENRTTNIVFFDF